MDILLIWIVFMLVFMALTYLLGERGAPSARGKEETSEQPSISSDTLKGFAERVARVFAVSGSEVRGAGVMFEGRLRTSPEGAFAELRQVFAPDRLAPLLQDGTGGEVRLVLIPETEALMQRPAVVEKPNWAVHLLLFVMDGVCWDGWYSSFSRRSSSPCRMRFTRRSEYTARICDAEQH